MPMSGMDLKLRRVAAMVKLQDIAERMGRSRATIHRYEGLRVVPDETAAEYLAALAMSSEVAIHEDRPPVELEAVG